MTRRFVFLFRSTPTQILARVRPPLLLGNASVAGFGAFWSALNLGNIVYFVVCDLVNGKVHKYPEYWSGSLCMLMWVMVTSVVAYQLFLYYCKFINWTPACSCRCIGHNRQVWESSVVSSINAWCLVCTPDVHRAWHAIVKCLGNLLLVSQPGRPLELGAEFSPIITWPRPPDGLPLS